MYSTIQNLPQHLQEAINLITYKNLNPTSHALIQHVVIAGMGSSGLAGTFVKQLVNDKLSVPLTINQNYTLPAYVNATTLLIAISYSGNTEETLAAFQLGIQKQARIVVITAGGILQTQAQKHAIRVLPLPANFLSRASIPYTLIHILFTLASYKLLEWNFIAETEDGIQLIQAQQHQIQTEAYQIANSIEGNIPVIYTTTLYEHLAIRLKQQLNENSKQLCWQHVIPEFNHNEIVGWESKQNNVSVIVLSGEVEDTRMRIQEKISIDILKKHTDKMHIIKAQGSTHLVRSIYLLHLCDWISFYLAQKKTVDPVTIRSIDQVKTALYEKI